MDAQELEGGGKKKRKAVKKATKQAKKPVKKPTKQAKKRQIINFIFIQNIYKNIWYQCKELFLKC